MKGVIKGSEHIRLFSQKTLVFELLVVKISQKTQTPDWGTPPLQEGSEASLLEIWSRSEERPSRFCGGQKGGELPSFDCVCAPLHDMKGP